MKGPGGLIKNTCVINILHLNIQFSMCNILNSFDQTNYVCCRNVSDPPRLILSLCDRLLMRGALHVCVYVWEVRRANKCLSLPNLLL